jgi:hypothetical protein
MGCLRNFSDVVSRAGKESVHTSLTSLFVALNPPNNNHGQMLCNPRLKMLVDITTPCYQVRKAATDRVTALLASGESPTSTSTLMIHG